MYLVILQNILIEFYDFLVNCEMCIVIFFHAVLFEMNCAKGGNFKVLLEGL